MELLKPELSVSFLSRLTPAERALTVSSASHAQTSASWRRRRKRRTGAVGLGSMNAVVVARGFLRWGCLRPQAACKLLFSTAPRRSSEGGRTDRMQVALARNSWADSETTDYPVDDALPAWWLSASKRKSRRDAQGVSCLLLKRTIRQFEEITHAGTVVIWGNVAPGATVRADGDIVVLGRLSGQAFAGCSGDFGASVVALAMEPSLLGIASRVSSGPEGGPSAYPELAALGPNGNICIEPLQLDPSMNNARGGGGGLSASSAASSSPDPVLAKLAQDKLMRVQWATEPKGPQTQWSAAAIASAVTGAYILLAGALVAIAPDTVFADC